MTFEWRSSLSIFSWFSTSKRGISPSCSSTLHSSSSSCKEASDTIAFACIMFRSSFLITATFYGVTLIQISSPTLSSSFYSSVTWLLIVNTKVFLSTSKDSILFVYIVYYKSSSVLASKGPSAASLSMTKDKSDPVMPKSPLLFGSALRGVVLKSCLTCKY